MPVPSMKMAGTPYPCNNVLSCLGAVPPSCGFLVFHARDDKAQIGRPSHAVILSCSSQVYLYEVMTRIKLLLTPHVGYDNSWHRQCSILSHNDHLARQEASLILIYI
jgi:hypothetical protein